MVVTVPLQPTLWRTCRVIANRTRLGILQLAYSEPGLGVSEVAQRLGIPLSAASHSLRALEARGLLEARRAGKWVRYLPPPAQHGNAARSLAAALGGAFRTERDPISTMFDLATAFTHARRVTVFRALQRGPQTRSALRAATRISDRALGRHLEKLKARGFVTCDRGVFVVPRLRGGVRRALAALAAG